MLSNGKGRGLGVGVVLVEGDPDEDWLGSWRGLRTSQGVSRSKSGMGRLVVAVVEVVVVVVVEVVVFLGGSVVSVVDVDDMVWLRSLSF